MKANLITIGDEILSGRTVDTNSNFLAKKLDETGITVIKIATIDEDKTIKEKLAEAFSSDANFIFTTGGLGPTKDDKTKQAIVDFILYFNFKSIGFGLHFQNILY